MTPPAGVTDPDPGDNTATDTDTIEPMADLSITKTDGVTTVVAGTTTTYTIIVTNSGPSAVTAAIVDRHVPGRPHLSRRCAIGAAPPAGTPRTGSHQRAVTLPAGGSHRPSPSPAPSTRPPPAA